jgi:hypothetical protein
MLIDLFNSPVKSREAEPRKEAARNGGKTGPIDHFELGQIDNLMYVLNTVLMH